jgi:general secretion pathway protein I
MNNKKRLNTKNNRQLKQVVLGFTLIEVMLAMAIFAIAGVALVSSADTTFKNLSHLETKVFASWVASNQLVSASLEPKWPLKNKKKGKVEMAGREWFWQQKVLKTEDKNMSQLVMEVRLEEKGEHSLAELTTYVAKGTP